MSALILTKPAKFHDQLPAGQRAAGGPRKSELKDAVQAFVTQMLDHRDRWAVAATHVSSGQSAIYEAFREAGCEVRWVQATDPETKEPLTEKRNDSKGVEKVYPVQDCWVMLPAGEIKNRSGRQPWVPPATRLQTLRAEYSDRATSKDRRAEIEASVEAILDRNPKLDGHAGWKRVPVAATA